MGAKNRLSAFAGQSDDDGRRRRGCFVRLRRQGQLRAACGVLLTLGLVLGSLCGLLLAIGDVLQDRPKVTFYFLVYAGSVVWT